MGKGGFAKQYGFCADNFHVYILCGSGVGLKFQCLEKSAAFALVRILLFS
jgi:hypothetical protein